MRLHIIKIINKYIALSVFITLIVATAVLFYVLVLRISDLAIENQTYNRYISCVLSVSPQARDQSKIDHCWVEVQADTGVEVKRYDE